MRGAYGGNNDLSSRVIIPHKNRCSSRYKLQSFIYYKRIVLLKPNAYMDFLSTLVFLFCKHSTLGFLACFVAEGLCQKSCYMWISHIVKVLLNHNQLGAFTSSARIGEIYLRDGCTPAQIWEFLFHITKLYN